MQIEQTLISIVSQLLEDPSTLSCDVGQSGNAKELILITTDPKDLPRIIGKNGRTISAIRTVVRAIYASKGNTERLLITCRS